MPRPSNTKYRRIQIAEAMMKLMAARGYDRTSMSGIAEASGLSQGLIHYHFKNKQEILLMVLQMMASRHKKDLDARLVEAGDDPLRKISNFIDFHLGLVAGNDPETLACWIVINGEALRQKDIREEFEKAMGKIAGLLTKIIHEGLETGLITCGNPEAAAGALLALIQGFYVIAANTRDLIPKGSAAESARKMANGLLEPSRPF